MYPSHNATVGAAVPVSHNVDCFLQVNYVSEPPASAAEEAPLSPGAEKVLSLLADFILFLRRPRARVIRFFAVLSLAVLSLCLVAVAGLGGKITLLQALVRVAGTVLFGVLGTLGCL